MYRRYEDPHKLAQMLEKAEAELEQMKLEFDEDHPDALIDQYDWVESLRERLNFAWQDDEYDELNASY